MAPKNKPSIIENLSRLQSLIAKEKVVYVEEFNQQLSHFDSYLELFKLNPSVHNKDFNELVMFLAHTCHYYPNESKGFPQKIISLLNDYGEVLHPMSRSFFCKALTLLRSHSQVELVELINLFFTLLQCQDKGLKKFIRRTIISDIKRINETQKNSKVNRVLLSRMFAFLKDGSIAAQKTALAIMTSMFSKGIWTDARCVNSIAIALFSKCPKVQVAALKFFLNRKEDNQESDSEVEDNRPSAKEVARSYKVNKKTRKRKKLMEAVKRINKVRKKPEKMGFPAIQLLNDPHGTASRLFGILEKTNEKWEVKILMMEFIARLIGIHQLFLFNFYPYVQRYLTTSQKDVTKILMFSAQAAHELVPPDVVEPMVRAIADNFVTDRNSNEAICVGLNAIRYICNRAPFSISPELLQDLILYNTHRDKGVRFAARSLLQMYRLKNPSMLRKKERGKPTEAASELRSVQYGQVIAHEFLPGIERLVEDHTGQLVADAPVELRDKMEAEDEKESEGSTEEGMDETFMEISGEEEEEEEDEDEDEDEDDDDDDDDEGDSDDKEEEEEEDSEMDSDLMSEDSDEEEEEEEAELIDNPESVTNEQSTSKGETADGDKKPAAKGKMSEKLAKKVERKKKAMEAKIMEKAQAIEFSSTRILTQDEFRQLRLVQLRKNLEASRPKRFTPGQKAIKKGQAEDPDLDLSDLSEAEEEAFKQNDLVTIDEIEKLHVKTKADKQSKIASAMVGRQDRAKFSKVKPKMDPHASQKEKTKKKNKAFAMVKPKLRGKKKKSFRDKQIALRNALIKKAKMGDL